MDILLSVREFLNPIKGSDEFNIWLLLGGIGMLLFGMEMFEEAIASMSKERTAKIIEKNTSNPWKAIFTGSWLTTVLQSSSAVSLIVLGFAGAGIIKLMSGIGVIIGANIGTAVSSLLVAKIGFGTVKISAFAMPLIAFGGIVAIFTKSKKRDTIARIAFGFGLLFIGISFMKDSVDVIKNTFDIAQYKDSSLWIFGLIGMIFTAVVQSSTTVGFMTLAALSGGIITFPASIAIIMGANIGTTVTSVLASLGGRRIKQQLALSQVLFNLISGVIGVALFWVYINLTLTLMGLPLDYNPDDPGVTEKLVVANAVLNAIFNVSTAVLFGFFLKPFTQLVRTIIPGASDEERAARGAKEIKKEAKAKKKAEKKAKKKGE